MPTIPAQNMQYLQQVVAWQPRLLAFALSLTGSRNEADDVLQDTNVMLLEKQDQFQTGAAFSAWAMQIAYHQVRRHWTACARSRRRFDSILLDQLAMKMMNVTSEPSDELRFLRHCMLRLPASEREMLTLRYGGDSVGSIAANFDRSVASISQTLYRIRVKLARCLRTAIEREHRNES